MWVQSLNILIQHLLSQTKRQHVRAPARELLNLKSATLVLLQQLARARARTHKIMLAEKKKQKAFSMSVTTESGIASNTANLTLAFHTNRMQDQVRRNKRWSSRPCGFSDHRGALTTVQKHGDKGKRHPTSAVSLPAWGFCRLLLLSDAWERNTCPLP